MKSPEACRCPACALYCPLQQRVCAWMCHWQPLLGLVCLHLACRHPPHLLLPPGLQGSLLVLPGQSQGCPLLHPLHCCHCPELVCLQQQDLLLPLLLLQRCRAVVGWVGSRSQCGLPTHSVQGG